MKRKTFLFFIVGTVLAVSFLAFEAVNARRTGPGTTKVSINGRSFIVGNSSMDGRSALRRELARLGVDVPENSESLDMAPRSSRSFFPEKPLTTGKITPEKTPRLPEGFKVDKTLKMSREDGTVLMVMGTTAREGRSAATHLEADKWTRMEIAGGSGLPKVFQKTRGKETDIVCLDEKEGSFLLLRRLER